MITMIADKIYSIHVTRWCASRPRYEITITSLVFVLAIGFVDYVTGPNISLSVIYLLPIVMTTWFVGQSCAIALSVLSVAVWFYGYSLSPGHVTGFFVMTWNSISYSFSMFFPFCCWHACMYFRTILTR